MVKSLSLVGRRTFNLILQQHPHSVSIYLKTISKTACRAQKTAGKQASSYSSFIRPEVVCSDELEVSHEALAVSFQSSFQCFHAPSSRRDRSGEISEVVQSSILQPTLADECELELS